jgi:iron(III) transport system substrate-binding protein
MKHGVILTAALFSASVLFAGGKAESWNSVEEWQKAAQMGLFQPVSEDWDTIAEKAEAEKKLIIYTTLPEVEESARSFSDRYGLKTDVTLFPAGELFQALLEEQGKGKFRADVVVAEDVSRIYNELFDQGRIVRYVPREVEALLLPAAAEAPLGVHHFGAVGLVYRSDVFEESPVDSWWDLTREEWRGRVVMVRPRENTREFRLLATLVQNHVVMEESFQDEFRRELVKSDDLSNAGYEFLRRLYQNGLILEDDEGAVKDRLARSGGEDPVLALSALSGDSSLALAEALLPAAGLQTFAVAAPGVFAPHPQGAKLFIRWLYGEADSDLEPMGWQPFSRSGYFSALRNGSRTGNTGPVLPGRLFPEDGDWLFQEGPEVAEFLRGWEL